MAIKSYRDLVDAAKATDKYWIENAKHDLAFGLHRQIRRSGMSNAELATKLDVKPPYISKVMRGDENLTIESMVKLVRAAGGRLHIQVADQADGVRWFNVIAGKCNMFTGDAEAFRQSQAIKTKSAVIQSHVEEMELYAVATNNR